MAIQWTGDVTMIIVVVVIVAVVGVIAYLVYTGFKSIGDLFGNLGSSINGALSAAAGTVQNAIASPFKAIADTVQGTPLGAGVQTIDPRSLEAQQLWDWARAQADPTFTPPPLVSPKSYQNPALDNSYLSTPQNTSNNKGATNVSATTYWDALSANIKQRATYAPPVGG